MRRVLFAIFTTVAGLVGLLSFKTQPASLASSPAAITTTDPGTTSSSSGSGSTATHSAGTGTSSARAGNANSSASKSTTGPSSTSATKKTSTRTVTGDVVNTPYGPVQVRIVVTNGAVTKAGVVQYPGGNSLSDQINAYAIPILEKETVGAKSASIDMVSGATYTSEGYLQSLQSALNKAGI